MTIDSGQQALAADMLKSLNENGYLQLTDSTELTISGGAVSVTANFYRVDTEGDTSTDDLDTITAGTGVAGGHILVLRAENATRTVVIKHNTGNILCVGNGDIILDDSGDFCILVYDGNLTKWLTSSYSGILANNVSLKGMNAAGTAAKPLLSINTSDEVALFSAGVNVKIINNAQDTVLLNLTDAGVLSVLGNAVPHLHKRQGGSSSVWSTEGTTDYTPASVRMQAGVCVTSGSIAGGSSGSVGITFPTAFSNDPIVLVTSSETRVIVSVDTANITASGCTVTFYNDGSSDTLKKAMWLAIGPP